jgi:hypothetical protein
MLPTSTHQQPDNRPTLAPRIANARCVAQPCPHPAADIRCNEESDV